MKRINLFLIAIISIVILTSATTRNFVVNSLQDVTKSIKLGTQKDVSATEFNKLIIEKKYTVLDIRTIREFNAGHIKNALVIDWYQRTFEIEVQKLDKTKPILIYCRSGNRTGKAKFALLGMGFQEVYNLELGINDWSRNQFELVR